MVVPVGETIQLTLTSRDVIHGFYVPAFLFKRDVIPGQANAFDFTVDEPGTYTGQCTQFCGLFHHAMTFTLRAVTPAEFDAWLAQKQATPAPSPAASPAPPGSPAPSGAPSEVPAGTVLRITAANVAYDVSSLEVPANTPFAIEFTNNDPGIPHNVAIHGDSPTGPELWQGDIVTGVTTITYQVAALPAGTYGFVCTVHPNMTGTLTVK